MSYVPFTTSVADAARSFIPSGLMLASDLTRSISLAFVLLVLILIISYVIHLRGKKRMNEPVLITNPVRISSMGQKPFDATLMPRSTTGSEYSYAFFMFIDDWSTNYGKPKCVMYRGTGEVNEFTSASPSVWLYPKENKLMVRISTLSSDLSYDPVVFPQLTVDESGYTVVNPLKLDNETFNVTLACDIEHIPLQKWCHVTVCVWNRTVDVYLNGSLARSSVLPGVPLNDPSKLARLYVGAGNTFDGYISNLQYFNRAVTADEVYALYASGPSGPRSWLDKINEQLKIIFKVTV